MKSSKLIVLISVIILIGFGAWFVLGPTPIARPSLAKMLPENTWISAELINLEKTIEEYKISRLHRKIKETDINKVLEVMGISVDDVNQFNNIKSAILSNLDSILFKELFGLDTMVALLPINLQQVDDVSKFLSCIVLVSKTKHGPGLVEFVNALVSKQLETKTQKYLDYDITSMIMREGLVIYYTIVDGFMVTTLDFGTMKNCLQGKTEKLPNLANHSYYNNFYHRLFKKESKSLVFINTGEIYKSLSQQLSPLAGRADRNINQITSGLSNLKGFNAIAYSSYDDGSNIIRSKWLSSFNKRLISPANAKIYSIPPEGNKTWKMIPRKTMLYYWTNVLDFNVLKELYIDKSQIDHEDLKELESKFYANMGISIDDVGGSIGNQGALIIEDIKTGGAFPIPSLSVLLQIKNEDALDKFINELVRQTKMGFQEERVQDVTIKYITTLFGSDIQPAYTFWKGFCVIASNRKLLHEMLNAAQDGQSILSAQSFRDVNIGLTDKNNTVTFMRTDLLLDKGIALTEWGGNILGMKGPREKEKGNVVLKNLVHPVLDGLKMYKTIGVRSVIQENEMEVNSNTCVVR